MQWVTIVTYCLEDEAASGKAEAAVAYREPGSQRRTRRGALPNGRATSTTRREAGVHPAREEGEQHLGGRTSMAWVVTVT